MFGDGEGQVSTFYFPANEGTPTLVGGIVRRRVPRRARGVGGDAVPRLARVRQRPPGGAERDQRDVGVSGFLTGNLNADPSLWNELEQGFLEMLETGDPAAFDASDQMPAEVGTGHVLDRGAPFVNGDEDAQTAADNIEASWPASSGGEEAAPTTGG